MYRSYSLNSRSLYLSHQKKKSNFQNQSIVNQHKSLKKFPYKTFLSPLWFPFGFWHCHLKNNITAIEGCPLHPAHHVLLLANISQDLLTVQIFMRLTLVAFNIMPRTTVAKINLRFWLVLASSLIIICFVDQNNPNVTVQRAHFEGFFTIQSITLELINGKLKKGFPMLPDFQCTWWLLGKHSFFSKVLEQLGGAKYQIS